MILSLLLIFLGLLLIFLVFGIFMIISFMTGAPYVGMDKRYIKTIIRLARLREGQTIIDLGSGDGRVLLVAACSNLLAIGYEINPVLCVFTRLRIMLAKQRSRASVYCKNFWNADISRADAVMIYAIPHIMDRLQHKIQTECKKGTRVVSFGFTFPNWNMIADEGRVKVYEV